MAYIGKQPLVGNFVKLDAITTSATTTFNLTNGGVAYFPQSANNCLVSLNGILQAPTDSYTISGSTIVFSSALTTSDVIDFIIVLGDVLSLATVSDSTIGLAKLTATGTPSSSTFLRGDNSWASAATAGQVIQVVTATDSTQRSTTSTSFVTASNTLSISITPSSASNKIFVISSGSINTPSGSYAAFITLFRDSTNLGNATEGMGRLFDAANSNCTPFALSILDSPSSTSALTYQVYIAAQASSPSSVQLNQNGAKGSITAFEIKG
jgi:hypothetical protein